MEKIGVVYVAYGHKAVKEAKDSIATLRRHNGYDVIVICQEVIGGADCICFDRPGPGARWAKLNVDRLVEYDRIAYLDADTRIKGSLAPAFAMLSNGWDLLLAISTMQEGSLFHHVGKAERHATISEIGNPLPLQLQCGVMFFDRQRCAKLFGAWRNEWLRWKDKDQAAFLRALNRSPVRVGLLGRDWNGHKGFGVIEHHFGRAR